MIASFLLSFVKGIGNNTIYLSGLFLVALAIFVAVRKGSAVGLVAVTVAVAVAVTVTVAVAFSFAFATAIAVTIAIAVAVTVTVAVASAVAVTVAVARAIAVTVAITAAFCFAITGAFCFAIAVAGALLGVYIGWRGLAGDQKHDWVRPLAIAFAARGGTSFRGANLTDANFINATLNSTDFRGAILTRTCWLQAKMLECVRPGTTYLQNAYLCQWLVGKGQNKNFDRQNLRGVNLKGANLADVSFISADLSEANLQDADLSRALLVQTQLDKTDLTGATLTGACIEDWGITSHTMLNRVKCEYIFMHLPTKSNPDPQRRPHNQDFIPGDFVKLFQKALGTIDLNFCDGVDWKGFAYSFNKAQVKNENIRLVIQSIENRGDGFVVVRVSVPPVSDQAKIYYDFIHGYELARKHLRDDL